MVFLVERYSGHFLLSAILKQLRAKPMILSSVLYIAQRHAISFEIEYFECLWFAAAFGGEGHGQFAFSFDHGIGCAVLIAESMTANDDRRGPVGDQPRNIVDHDGFAENGAIENIADRAVRALPHLFQVEFFYPRFIRRDGGAFDADTILADGIGCIDGHLVIGLIAVFHAKVISI